MDVVKLKNNNNLECRLLGLNLRPGESLGLVAMF